MVSANDLILIRAKFMAEHLSPRNVRGATLMILYDLQVPVNLNGFGYLLNVIPEALESSSQIVAKEIYGIVGDRCVPKVDVNNMEIAIREAIKAAWSNRFDDRWYYYFPEYVARRRKPPSNVEFIAAISYFLMLWQECCVKEANYANV